MTDKDKNGLKPLNEGFSPKAQHLNKPVSNMEEGGFGSKTQFMNKGPLEVLEKTFGPKANHLSKPPADLVAEKPAPTPPAPVTDKKD